MSDEVRVTVIATGFGDENQKMISDQISKLKLMAQANILNSMPAEQDAPEGLSQSMSHTMNPQMAETLSPQPTMPAMEKPAMEPNLTQPLSTPVVPTEALPRDILMAKVKAFKDSQDPQSTAMQPEQLTMNVDEGFSDAGVMESTPSSPFDSENLEIPSYLRKQQMNDEGRS